MEVDNSIKESLVANNHRFMYINGKRYYVKLCEDNFNLKEIIAKRLADILGIKCANYDIIKTDDNIYYVSEDLNILGNARNLSIISAANSSLYLIWDALEKNLPGSQELMQELIQIYFFDLLFLNSDRKLHNIMLVNSDNKEIVLIVYKDFLALLNNINLETDENNYINLVDGINSYFQNDTEFPFLSDYQ